MKYPRYNELDYFYGNPRSPSDPKTADKKWIEKSLVYIVPPYPLYTSWDGKSIGRLRVHKRCYKDMLAALQEIAKSIPELDRKRFQLDRCGGTYEHRPVRGYDWNKLSVHAYGAAIDLAPGLNKLGQKYDINKRMMPKEVIDIFLKNGAEWGGIWQRPDAQHFQFSRI